MSLLERRGSFDRRAWSWGLASVHAPPQSKLVGPATAFGGSPRSRNVCTFLKRGKETLDSSFCLRGRIQGQLLWEKRTEMTLPDGTLCQASQCTTHPMKGAFGWCPIPPYEGAFLVDQPSRDHHRGFVRDPEWHL
jgi:hypothetical protein